MKVRESSPTREKKEKLGEAQLQAVSELFAVLSEPTRLRILQMLQDGPASVGEIVETLGIKQANASKQLGILHQAGVLAREKAGNSSIYSIRMPLVFDLCELVCNGLRAEAEAKLRQLA
jgi:DNA-binding transcriptional ArsR family regulator